MWIAVKKRQRTLALMADDRIVFQCRVALGSAPAGAKRMQGDGRTPEGRYFICLIRAQGKYGRSLGVSYPNAADAQTAFCEGRIDERTLRNVQSACSERRRPPWGSPLGGEICIHEGGSQSDWTAGCIALDERDMDVLFPSAALGMEVVIQP